MRTEATIPNILLFNQNMQTLASKMLGAKRLEFRIEKNWIQRIQQKLPPHRKIHDVQDFGQYTGQVVNPRRLEKTAIFSTLWESSIFDAMFSHQSDNFENKM